MTFPQRRVFHASKDFSLQRWIRQLFQGPEDSSGYVKVNYTLVKWFFTPNKAQLHWLKKDIKKHRFFSGDIGRSVLHVLVLLIFYHTKSSQNSGYFSKKTLMASQNDSNFSTQLFSFKKMLIPKISKKSALKEMFFLKYILAFALDRNSARWSA